MAGRVAVSRRSAVGEWWLLWLLIDPSVRPARHPLGRVFDVGVVLDGWFRPETLRRLSVVGAPEARGGSVVRRRLEGLRTRGVCPVVRVVVWHSSRHSPEAGPGLERWGRLAFGLDPKPRTTPVPARQGQPLGQRVVAGAESVQVGRVTTEAS